VKLDDLGPNPGSVKRRKRIGRGIGSGHGVRATRGNKGDKARGQSKLGFEGGQTPLHRRLPKQRGIGTGLSSRGFNTGRFGTDYTIVNLSELELFESGTVITPELLFAQGIVKELKKGGIKILGDGEFTKSVTVHAHKFSGSAESKINNLGGSVVVLRPAYQVLKDEKTAQANASA
jgi:large subunit ribosomal protein L15